MPSINPWNSLPRSMGWNCSTHPRQLGPSSLKSWEKLGMIVRVEFVSVGGLEEDVEEEEAIDLSIGSQDGSDTIKVLKETVLVFITKNSNTCIYL